MRKIDQTVLQARIGGAMVQRKGADSVRVGAKKGRDRSQGKDQTVLYEEIIALT